MADQKAKIILDTQTPGVEKLDDVNKKLGTTANKSKKASDGFDKFKVAALAAAATVGYMAKQQLAQSIKKFAEFETGLTNVYTLLDKETFQKFGKQLEKETIGILNDYSFAMGDVNKAMFDAVSAGIDAGNAVDFLKSAAVLAQGGVTGLGVAVNGMTSIINAYGLDQAEATDVANAFFTAQKFGKTTVEELSNSIGKVAPIASAAGISYQELLAAASQLTLSGISTDEAMTALKGTITAIIKPMDESKQYFDALGIATGRAAFENGGLSKTMSKLADASGGNIDVLAKLIPNVRALLGVTSLATEKGLKKYDQILLNVKTDTESLSTAFEMQQDTVTNITETYKNKYNVALMSVGKNIGSQIKGFAKLNDVLAKSAPAKFATDMMKVFDKLKENVLLTLSEISSKLFNFFNFKWGLEDKEAEMAKVAMDTFLADTDTRMALKEFETIAAQANEETLKTTMLNAIQKIEAAKIAAAQAEKGRKKALKEAAKIAAVEKKKADKEQAKYDKQLKDEEIAREQYLADAKTAILANTSNVFMDLYLMFGEQYRALFEIGKAAAIADTIVQTYKGATAAVASMAGAGPIGWIAGAIQAAAIITSGTAAARNIAMTQMEFGGIIPGSPMGTPIVAGEKGKSEAIIPLDTETQQQLGIGGGQTVINVMIENLYTDDKEAVRKLADNIDEVLEHKRSMGNSVFGNGMKNQLAMGVT